MNILRADQVRPAEAYARTQRVTFARFLAMDKKKAGNPADIAMCERMIKAALLDAGEYENLLTFPEVNNLFCKGALFFRPREIGH